MVNGMTGHLFEEEMLGKCNVSYRGTMRYETRETALATARKSQPQTKSPVGRFLEKEVSQLLGRDVQYFTAVRTGLDFFHGVDAFFVFEGLVVTVDVTINPEKDACKAEVLAVAEEFTSRENLRQLASRIAREFVTKQRRAA